MINLLKKNEMEVLILLFDNLVDKYTINSLSKKLNQNYAQTYRIVIELEKKNLIKLEKIGNLKQVLLNWREFNLDYSMVEIQRSKDLPNVIHKIINKLSLLEEDFCVILFGSYANNTFTKNSDIDLLIFTNENKLKKKIENVLSLYDCDLNFVSFEEVFDMWNSSKINVGNEILKNHKVLLGYDYFIKLLFQKNNV